MNTFLDGLLSAVLVLMVLAFGGLIIMGIFAPGREPCRDGYVLVKNVCVQGYVPGWKN